MPNTIFIYIFFLYLWNSSEGANIPDGSVCVLKFTGMRLEMWVCVDNFEIYDGFFIAIPSMLGWRVSICQYIAIYSGHICCESLSTNGIENVI
jgi:hypothetical protein